MNKEVLRLAIPNILSNISVPLLSTVDTALMGRLSEWHIGAVGLGAMIFNFVYWNFGFLRMGTTGITAQAFGQRNENDIIHTMGRALAIALLLAFLILFLQVPFRHASIFLMQVEPEMAPLVIEYFNIRIWAAPATLALYALMGWFFGMQNAIYPLILTLFINSINIILSYILVFRMGMEVDGVAWGTVVAQYAGFVLGLILFFYKYRTYLKFLEIKVLAKWEALRRFLSINGDIFIRTFFLTFAFGFFYSQSSAFGENLLAVNVILLQYLNWMSYGIDGFAFASESLVGKYFGARDERGTLRAIRLSFLWSAALAVGVALIYAIFGRQLLYIFTDQVEVVEAAIPYMGWMVLFPIIAFGCYIWDGVYIGLTASRAMRNSMLIALMVYLIAYYALSGPYTNHGLWAALLIFLGARGAFQWWLFQKYKFALR